MLEKNFNTQNFVNDRLFVFYIAVNPEIPRFSFMSFIDWTKKTKYFLNLLIALQKQALISPWFPNEKKGAMSNFKILA